VRYLLGQFTRSVQAENIETRLGAGRVLRVLGDWRKVEHGVPVTCNAGNIPRSAQLSP
jgi:hypothetical protein